MITIGQLFAIVSPAALVVVVGTVIITSRVVRARRPRPHDLVPGKGGQQRHPAAQTPPPLSRRLPGDLSAVERTLMRSQRDYSSGAGHMDEAHEFWTGEHALNWAIGNAPSNTGEPAASQQLRLIRGNSHALWAIWTKLNQMHPSIHHPALPRRVDAVLSTLDHMVEIEASADTDGLRKLAKMLRGEDDCS